MSRLQQTFNWREFVPFLALAGTLAVAAFVLDRTGDQGFARFLGDLHPVLAVAIATALGAAALAALARIADFRPAAAPGARRTFVPVAVVTTAFAFAMIGADLVWRFPVDINIALPQALLLYPVMGLIAEAVFHLVPLAVLLGAAALLLRRRPGRQVIWLAMLPVALVEPVFQVSADLFEPPVAPLSVFVVVHLTAFSLIQLEVLRRYGFLALFGMRMVYYAWWHLAWGYARLELLF